MKKVLHSDITPGEKLAWNVYDEQGMLLLRKGVTPVSKVQIDHLISDGYYREDKNKTSSPPPDVNPEHAPRSQARPDVTTNEEYDQPFMLQGWQKPEAVKYVIVSIEDAIQKLEPLLKAIIHKRPYPDLHADIFTLADALQKVVRLSQDTCLTSIFFSRHSTDKYPVRHSIDTALIAIAIALPLELSRREISRIAAAALTMNVGMLALQSRLVSKIEPLNDAEQQAIFDHPMISVNLLQEAGIKDPFWLDDVLCHHEKLDGSGYPLSMAGTDIPKGAQIISLADRYTAMITPCKYREAQLPTTVLRQLLFNEGQTIEVIYAGILTKLIGIYPPGTFVRLKNREVAVVVGKGHDGATPQVKAILSESNKPLGIPVLRDTKDERYAIVGAVSLQPDEIPFTLKKILNIDGNNLDEHNKRQTP